VASKVSDVMTSPAIFVDPFFTVNKAASLMYLRHIQGLVVADEDGWYGFITTTDIRDKVLFAHRDPETTIVQDIASAPLASANPAWSVGYCAFKMIAVGAQCLPVADQRGRIIGIVSNDDIISELVE
jgi:predicted transcriptional regulator